MTTITYRAGVMCSDSQATRGDFIDNKNSTKIYEVGGCLIGTSGNAISTRKFIEWFSEMLEHSTAQEAFPFVTMVLPEKMVEEDFHALVVYPDKTAYEFFGCENVIECAEEYAAVGSGMLYALCAMDAGASAEDACRVAIKRDVYSGGEIQKYSLEEQEEITEEDIRSMSHEKLLSFVLGEDVSEDEEPEVTDTQETDVHFDGSVVFFGDAGFDVQEATRDDLAWIAGQLSIVHAWNISEEKLRQRILDFLSDDE